MYIYTQPTPQAWAGARTRCPGAPSSTGACATAGARPADSERDRWGQN